jgi:glucose/arabinose dehydrogenase
MKTSFQHFGRGRSVLWSVISLLFFLIFQNAEGITTVRIGTGFARPVFAVSPPGDGERLFVLEQHTGKIRILNLLTRQINAVDFLDLAGLTTGSEQGLLGMAFDPNYADNGLFYLNVTVSGTGATEIRRYEVSADPDIADAGSGVLILTYSQPQTNHNGGWMDFGPDGMLYISSGDGGGSDDNDTGHTVGLGNGQDKTVLLGKMLRIDVHGDDFPADANRNYSIPADNPFVGIAGADEIWAYGLRNPWRCSFDRQTGDLYIGDVGQGAQEEIDFQPADSGGGENYGWRVMEGTLCHAATDPLPCNDPSFTVPIHTYGHVAAPNGGFAIVGGYVYRGPHPDLQGTYFFGDNVTDQIWTFDYNGVTKSNFTNRTAEMTPDVGTIADISSFGEDGLGNLYVLDLIGGEVFKILPEPVVSGDFNGDGFVNMVDLSWMAKIWLEPNCGFCGGFDFDLDLDTDLADLEDLAGLWLQ